MIRRHSLSEKEIQISARRIPRGKLEPVCYTETIRGGDGITEASESYIKVFGWKATRYDEPEKSVNFDSFRYAIGYVVSGKRRSNAIA